MNLYFKRKSNTEFHSSIANMDYFFLLEKGKWIFTESLVEAKIVPIGFDYFLENPNLADLLSVDQVALVWHIETSGDHVTPLYCRKHIDESEFYRKHKKTIAVHTNQIDDTDPQYINHSIMFNRQKWYFTEYDEEMCGTAWGWNMPLAAYSLSDIKKEFNTSNKKFLVLNRTRDNHPNEHEYSFNNLKIKLKHVMEEINVGMYISEPNRGIYLEYNGWNNSHYSRTIDESLAPVADHYYNTSYVSVGIETLVSNNEIFYPCEKYYNHLIKGNFPLIFSGPNVIERLKRHYGFKFPNWIDYSYDSIDSLPERFDSYTHSIEKISKLSLLDLHDLYLMDKYILDHNRSVFFNHPYDSLYQKVQSSINQLGW